MPRALVLLFIATSQHPSCSTNRSFISRTISSHIEFLLHHKHYSSEHCEKFFLLIRRCPKNCKKVDMLLCKTAAKIFTPNEPCRLQETCLRVLFWCKSKFQKEGICVHSPVIKLDLQDDLYLNNNLLTLYAKCFGVEQARHFFDEMPHRDVMSWTAVLSAHVRSRHHYEALEFFGLMLNSGQYPNEFTLSSAEILFCLGRV